MAWPLAVRRLVCGWPASEALQRVRVTAVLDFLSVEKNSAQMAKFGHILKTGGRDKHLPSAYDRIIQLNVQLLLGSTLLNFLAIREEGRTLLGMAYVSLACTRRRSVSAVVSMPIWCSTAVWQQSPLLSKAPSGRSRMSWWCSLPGSCGGWPAAGSRPPREASIPSSVAQFIPPCCGWGGRGGSTSASGSRKISSGPSGRFWGGLFFCSSP